MTSIEKGINHTIILQPKNLSLADNYKRSFHHSHSALATTSFQLKGPTSLSFTNVAFKPNNHLRNVENMEIIKKHEVPVDNMNIGPKSHEKNQQNKSFLTAKTTNTKPSAFSPSLKSPLKITKVNPPRDTLTDKATNQQIHHEGFKAFNYNSHNTKEGNQNFSHLHRRRPVYQRGNTEAQFVEKIKPIPQEQAKENSHFSSVPTACSTLGSSARTSSSIATIASESTSASSLVKNGHMSMTTVRPSGCVYLRPEQNIPEVFVASRRSTTFKPIVEAAKIESGKGEMASKLHLKEDGHSQHMNNSCENVNTVGNTNRAKLELPINNNALISRDDIVVTMRSVNV